MEDVMKLLTVTAALIALASPALAGDGPDFFKVRNVPKGDVLHVRNDPLPSSPSLLQINPVKDHEKIRNYGCYTGDEILAKLKMDIGKVSYKPAQFKGQTWCVIEVQDMNTVGWANAHYLKEAE
jgi:hypothetical protein